MRALTELLGVRLWEQFGKRIYLTDAGRALLDHAERMAAIVQEIDREFVGYREEGAGSVRVGASTSIGTYCFPALVAEFTSHHPRIEVFLEIENTAHIQERLLRNDFDIAYLGAAVTSPHLEAEPFLKDEIFFACAADHPLASPTPITWEQLAHDKLIIREPGSATRHTMEEYCRAKGLTFPRTIQLGSVEAIKQAVMAGLGISYFSGLTVRHELETGRLVRLNITALSVTRMFLAVQHRQKKVTLALHAFTEFAKAWANGRVLHQEGAET
jgi:DNA-binding transcriptional LysR family regulator